MKQLVVDPGNAACQCLAMACTIARSAQDAVELGSRLLAKPAFLREMGECLHRAAAGGTGIFDYSLWTAKSLAGSRMAHDLIVHVEPKTFHVIVF